MLEALQQGLHLIASVENILALFGGMLGGVIIGALPGLTGAMAVTLALPFTFYMPPITSLMLLLGIYKGSMYGGSISAILIRTPARRPPPAPCWTAIPWPGRARRDRPCTWPCTPPASRTWCPIWP